ncbi:hypothetical protein JOE59_003183 [Agromyces cerinus]|uniref:hypothetical protein n=1 Tax=Agromyces cerinus TaxID=33878 RepID=UPI00195A0F6D|nr:hypothetical protein [Agromyces cerinus]MBM7832478.1 hypothetical protein [Agromyces cerinus]
MLETSTRSFIARACALPPVSLAAAFERAVSLRRAGGKEASRALTLSAIDNSQLEHAVREALLPRADELDDFRLGLHSDAKSAVVIAARAVEKSAQLTPEQYALLVTPFVEVGLDVPARAGEQHAHGDASPCPYRSDGAE